MSAGLAGFFLVPVVLKLVVGKASDDFILLKWLSEVVPFGELLFRIVLVLIAYALIRHAVNLWRATHTCLLVRGSSGLTLVSRHGASTRMLHLGWHEIDSPVPSKTFSLSGCLFYLLSLISGGLLHTLLHTLFEETNELVLMRRRLQAKPLRYVYVPSTLSHSFGGGGADVPLASPETVLLTACAQQGLKRWLADGTVQIDAGYSPSPERPFLALDLKTRRLRAYPLHQVLLDEQPYEVSHLLDGSQEGSPASKQRLPGFALPYEHGYWIRADWNLISTLESRLRASESTTSVPQASPQPE